MLLRNVLATIHSFCKQNFNKYRCLNEIPVLASLIWERAIYTIPSPKLMLALTSNSILFFIFSFFFFFSSSLAKFYSQNWNLYCKNHPQLRPRRVLYEFSYFLKPPMQLSIWMATFVGHPMLPLGYCHNFEEIRYVLNQIKVLIWQLVHLGHTMYG